MFSKSSKGSASAADSQPAEKPSPPSIISADLRIFGDISSDGEIQIDGAVDGDIRTKTLLVGEGAHIKGEIVADTVHVHGTVSGQIKSRSVNLAKTAHVVGDILHEDLTIETGAFLEGHCKRMTEKKEPDEGKINVLGKDSTLPPGAKAKETSGVSVQSKGSASSSMTSENDDSKKVAAS
ncbi:MAG: polymer-forming cytoskeletal protein [Proteobacteria bacterium]|nr:polymer-forming cytoskeletal protein [Pseudomonadota bacterium]